MAAAAAPLSTSIDSMSSGWKSAMRLTTESWFKEGFEPAFDLVTAEMPEGIATLLTSIPSSTKSGSAWPLIEEMPRSRTCTPPPGAPSLRWILAPATLPCSAWSTVSAETSLKSSSFTLAIETGTFFLLISEARPDTTISSPMDSGESTTRAESFPAGRVTSRLA